MRARRSTFLLSALVVALSAVFTALTIADAAEHSAAGRILLLP